VLRLGASAALLALALAPAGTAAADEPCTSWPGEPSPLPNAHDSDRLLSGWARVRARELGELAKELEAVRPIDARRLWNHALCLDPGSAVVHEGLARTTPIRVVHPAVVTGPPPPADAEPPTGSLAEQVEAPIRVPRSVARTGPDLAEIDSNLRYAQRLLQAARFEDGLRAAKRAEQGAQAAGEGAAARERQARAAVLCATAEIALGREDDAQQSLGRALDAQPGLSLDPATTSPKIVRALESARAAREAGR
jgi:hypothetical protein